jgi:hypothetical protein
MADTKDNFSAGEQALGYLYQVRFALLQMVRLPEDAACFIERDDDLDFTDPVEGQLLASLKHKARGDRLTDLCPDFWKSVRIWLTRYQEGKQTDVLPTFFLFTTGTVAEGSFLENFLPGNIKPDDIAAKADAILGTTTSKTILKAKDLFNELDDEEKNDFLSRISIFDNQIRIENIPAAIMDRMRTVPTKSRSGVYQRLEGWWVDVAIKIMTGDRLEPAYGWEVSEMLATIADQFKTDNLPIDFIGKEPPEGVNPEADDRMFVLQLRALGLKTERIRRAILDYYRAFEQRASWAREHLTINGEAELYDDRLVDEWDRYRAIICENLDESSSDEILITTGRNLLNWVESNDSPRFRIRRDVSEAYVMIGSYHMLANEAPMPRVYWHPQFMQRLQEIVTPGHV